MYEANKKNVDFYWVYTKEAHASDGRRPSRTVKIATHKTLEDRKESAVSCIAAIDLKIPLLVDDMKDSVGNAFYGHPDRLFILSPGGTIAYRGDKGPHGFDVDEMKTALAKIMSAKKSE